TFTYTIDDGNGGTDTATVTVTVGAVNDAPVAVDDSIGTDEDVPVTVNVLPNDSDPDGDTLTVTAVTQGTNGSVAIDPVSGNPVYTPDPDFNGTDTFTYTIDDGNGGTDTATVTVTVGAVNDAPVAVDDSIGTDEDVPVTVNVLPNDSDPDGDTLTVTAVTQGTNGTVTIDPVSGNPIYTPDADFNGTDTFTYTIDDGNGGTDTATVTVTVGAVNDAPVAVDDAIDTDEDGDVSSATLTITIGGYQSIDGSALADILRGTAADEYLSGYEGNDTLRGRGGDDVLDGGSGSDQLRGGGGNDTLIFDSADSLITGNAGFDTLIAPDNDDLDFSSISNIRNIERIDLTVGNHDILNLSVSDVLTMTDNDNLLEVLGDTSDSVELTNDWHESGNSVTQNGHTFIEYLNTDDSVTLLIEDQVNVTIL
ncbi:MAG: Ig-like domain-containing protein, partial [Candidatus Thiodiazotropha endolucinida]|nr:Ig-like domain-containing protein [Candidatus Thiodiazotropha taylori]MCW4262853.1 Ig-like domain-containing protein [Candidatus Thiodiazotropha endolucinida]